MNPLIKHIIIVSMIIPLAGVMAQPAETDDQIYEFITVDEKPVITTDAQPEYPQSAIDAGIDGTVVVKVVVDKTGRVSNAEIFRSVPQLDNAALDAARRKVFSAGKVAGNPVNTEMNIPIVFVLPEQTTVSDDDFGGSSGSGDVVELTAVIKAEPDRPRVNIISDRIKPEFDNINLEKSFRAELLGRAERIVIIQRSREELEPIEIKQILNRTR